MSQEFKSALEQEVCIERGKHYVKRFSRDDTLRSDLMKLKPRRELCEQTQVLM